MAVDFCDAAQRHWDDAEHLLGSTRLANADHLFGLAAECALKAVMQARRMLLLRSDGKPEEEKHRVHINKLWNEFITFANTPIGARYASLLSTSNPFHDWDVNQRYEHGSFWDPIKVQSHQNGAREAKNVLDNAITNGDIP